MTKSHKGSVLALSNQVVPVKFSTAHFNFKEDAIGVQHGELVNPIGAPVFSLRKTEGKFGGALAVEDGTTNFLASGISNYNAMTMAHWTGATLTNVGNAPNGSPIFRYVTSGTSYIYTHNYVLQDDLVTLSSKTIIFSLYVRRVEGSATGQIRVYDDKSSYSYMPINVTTEFKRFEMRKTIGASPTRMFVMIDNTGGGTYEFHSPQLEEKTFATSFVNGTRAQGNLLYPHPLYGQSKGVINFWLYFDDLAVGTNGRNQVWLWDYNGSLATPWFGIQNTSGQYSLSGFGGLSASSYHKSWHMYTIVKESDTLMKTYIDGVKVYETNSSDVSRLFKSSSNISIGSQENGAYLSNILISEFIASAVVPTTDEIRGWYESKTPFYNPYDYRGYAE